MSENDKKVLILDSTQLALFDECPYKWNLEYQENLERNTAYKEAMIMGAFGHKLLEIYYKSTASGLSESQSLDQALAFVPEDYTKVAILADYKAVLSNNPQISSLDIKQSVPFELDPEKIKLVKDRFYDYWMQQIGKNANFIPHSTQHVEVGFSEKMYESNDVLFILEGKMDGLGTMSGLDVIIDHKFQLKAHSLYKKSIQFRNYALIAKKNILIINYIRLTKKIDETTFVRDIVAFTPQEHDVWRQRLFAKFYRILIAIEHNQYEQRYGSCPGKFGYPCDFTPICEEWQQDLIERKKQELFHIKQEWKPW